MEAINLFSGASGLNTAVDPTRIDFDGDTGISDLQAAVNVTIDKTGRVSRRTGYLQKQAGNFHSLFRDTGDCIVAKDSAIYRVGLDKSITGIRSGLSGNKIDYAQDGDTIWYTDGTYNGRIIDGASSEWPTDEYFGVETHKAFTTAPVGHHIALFHAWMFVSLNTTLFFSEPYYRGMFALAHSRIEFTSKVLMIKPVYGGIFVSDSKFTWFLSGTNPDEFVIKKVANYPALEWGVATNYVEALDIGFDEPGLCAVWASSKGICLGTESGGFINLTKEKVVIPENCSHGEAACLLTQSNKVISTLGV